MVFSKKSKLTLSERLVSRPFWSLFHRHCNEWNLHFIISQVWSLFHRRFIVHHTAWSKLIVGSSLRKLLALSDNWSTTSPQTKNNRSKLFWLLVFGSVLFSNKSFAKTFFKLFLFFQNKTSPKTFFKRFCFDKTKVRRKRFLSCFCLENKQTFEIALFWQISKVAFFWQIFKVALFWQIFKVALKVKCNQLFHFFEISTHLFHLRSAYSNHFVENWKTTALVDHFTNDNSFAWKWISLFDSSTFFLKSNSMFHRLLIVASWSFSHRQFFVFIVCWSWSWRSDFRFIVIVIKTWNLFHLPKLFLAETKKLSTSSKRPSYFTCKKQALSRKILKVWKFFS